jgi:hypothetical protein
LTTEDFVRSAEFSTDVGIDHSEVTSLKQSLDNGSVAIGFSVGKQNIKVRNILSISNEQSYQCVGSVCVMSNLAYFVAFKTDLAYFNNLAHLVVSSYTI